MKIDIRAKAARYYDLEPEPLDDIPFYTERIPFSDASILELGCGTGRVLVVLADYCDYIHGVDISEAMISICRNKLVKKGIPSSKARGQIGDITKIDLGRTFDLIIAPYRVFQNLETDEQVDGFFNIVRRHLSRNGSCILNVFKPNRDPAGLRKEWAKESEYLSWEVPIKDGRVTCHGRNTRIDSESMILYPEIIYRTYRKGVLCDKAVLKIPMRCYYPEDFERLIIDHGFTIIERWGGYSGEPYGEGPELIIQFMDQN